MANNWEKIYRSDKLYRVEIVASFLKDQEIPTVILDKKDRAYQFGYYEIHVQRENVLHAIKLVEDNISFE